MLLQPAVDRVGLADVESGRRGPGSRCRRSARAESAFDLEHVDAGSARETRWGLPVGFDVHDAIHIGSAYLVCVTLKFLCVCVFGGENLRVCE